MWRWVGHINACRGGSATTCADVTDPPGRVHTGQPLKKCAIVSPAGHVAPNRVTCTALMDGALKAGELDRALEVH